MKVYILFCCNLGRSRIFMSLSRISPHQPSGGSSWTSGRQGASQHLLWREGLASFVGEGASQHNSNLLFILTPQGQSFRAHWNLVFSHNVSILYKSCNINGTYVYSCILNHELSVPWNIKERIPCNLSWFYLIKCGYIQYMHCTKYTIKLLLSYFLNSEYLAWYPL